MKQIGIIILTILTLTTTAFPQTRTVESKHRVFYRQRDYVRGLTLEAGKAPSIRRREILNELLEMGRADANLLQSMAISNSADESELATAIFALQPVILESVEKVAIKDNGTVRVAYHAVRALRLRSVAAAVNEPKKYDKAEIIAWARALQKIQPKIRQELASAINALKKSS